MSEEKIPFFKVKIAFVISEARVKLETAKLARQKGVHWPIIMQPIFHVNEKKINNNDDVRISIYEGGRNPCFNEDGHEITPKHYNINNKHYPRPTQSLLAKWLRVEHNIHVTPYILSLIDYKNYSYAVLKMNPLGVMGTEELTIHIHEQFSTYEAAMEAGLVFALNYLEDEQG